MLHFEGFRSEVEKAASRLKNFASQVENAVSEAEAATLLSILLVNVKEDSTPRSILP